MRNLTRLVAVVLIPCLISESVLAVSPISTNFARVQNHLVPPVFTEECLSTRDIPFLDQFGNRTVSAEVMHSLTPAVSHSKSKDQLGEPPAAPALVNKGVVIRGYTHIPSDKFHDVTAQLYDESDAHESHDHPSHQRYRNTIDTLLTEYQSDIANATREMETIRSLLAERRHVAIGVEDTRVQSAKEYKKELDRLRDLMERHRVPDAAVKSQQLFLCLAGPTVCLLATGTRAEVFPLERAELYNEAWELNRSLNDAEKILRGLTWDPLESTCRHASLSIL